MIETHLDIIVTKYYDDSKRWVFSSRMLLHLHTKKPRAASRGQNEFKVADYWLTVMLSSSVGECIAFAGAVQAPTRSNDDNDDDDKLGAHD